MSGGSLNYASGNIDDAISYIESDKNPLYRAFAEHLKLVSKALHDIEWEFSGDYGTGDAEESVKKVLGDNAKSLCFEELRKEGIELVKKIEYYLDK